MTAKKRRKRPSGPSGKSGRHVHPRRLITAPAELFAAQDREAARAGLAWSKWVLKRLSGAP